MNQSFFVIFTSSLFFASALRLTEQRINPNPNWQLDFDIDHALNRTTAIMVEPRCVASLALSVWNVRSQLPNVKIQLFVSEVSEPAVKEWFGDDPLIQLEKLPGRFYEQSMTYEDYNMLLTSVDFWNMVKGDYALTFQTDSWVCGDAETTLSNFLKNYPCDYVGAPWDRDIEGCDGVGNGGFSLRNVKAMREVTAREKPAQINEDVWFCNHLGQSQVCDASSAGHFANEEKDSHQNVVGTHRPWKYGWFTDAHKFKDFCPGLGLAERTYYEPLDPDCAHAIQKGKALMTEADKLSKGQSQWFKKPTRFDYDRPFVFTITKDILGRKEFSSLFTLQ